MRLALVICLFLLFAAPSRAELPPSLPCSWSGETNLPEDSYIESWSGAGHGRYHWTTRVFLHQSTPVYRIDVKADDPTTTEREGAMEGEFIAFRALSALYPYDPIGWANEVGTWRSGANNPNFYLTFPGGSNSTPTITPSSASRLRLVLDAPSAPAEDNDRGEWRICYRREGRIVFCVTIDAGEIIEVILRELEH